MNEALYRGRQPGSLGIQRLAAAGVRTVVSLRTGRRQVARERTEVIAAGMQHVNIPLRPHRRPVPETVARVLEILTRPESAPVFVHCLKGDDRTGVIVACYRIAHDGWSAQRALEEARQEGIGWWQRGMRAFVPDGCRGPSEPERGPARP